MSILNEFTKEKHREVESAPFVQYMIQGNMTQEHYIVFLQQIYHVYNNIEHFAKLVGLLSDLPDIERTEYILDDLKEMGAAPASVLLPSIEQYCAHLNRLYLENKTNNLLAHVYVRHMGDMYGGKFIAQKVPGPTRSYQFADRSAVIKALNSKLSVDLVPEALIAFDMSMNIFNDLDQALGLSSNNIVSLPTVVD